MRKALAVAGGLAAVLALVLWALHATDPEAVGDAAAVSDPLSQNRQAGDVARRLKERLENPDAEDLRPSRGDLELRGRVIGPSGPVAGAVVTATVTEAGDTLSELPCRCGNACGMHLLECMCGEAAGQLVTLVADRLGEAAPVARATTDAEGTFVLSGLENRPHALWAQAQDVVGLKTGALPGDVAADVMVEPGAFLAGHVRDEKKGPLAGAVVTAIFAEHSRFFDVLSGEDGAFRIGPVPHGSYAVVALQGELLPANAKVREDASEPLELVLYRPRQLSGRVVRGGTPVAAATVRMEGEHRKEEVKSARDGTFAFSRLRPGDYSVLAEDGSVSAVNSLEVGDGDATVELSLVEGVRLQGTVRSSAGGPVAGAAVTLQVEQGEGSVTLRTTSGAEGEWSFPAAPAGDGEVAVKAEGFLRGATQEVKLAGSAPAPLEFVLDPASPVSGVVVDPVGQPVAKASIGFKGPGGTEWATSDAQGTFVIKQAVAGSGRLTVDHPDWAPLRQPLSAPSSGLRLSLVAGLELRGKVLAQEQPVARAGVRIESQDPEQQGERTVTAGADGTFVLRGLSPGDHRISATVSDGDALRTSETVAVKLPAVEAVVVRFVDSFEISGTVVDGSGSVVAGVTVYATPARGSPEQAGHRRYQRPFTVESGADGAFQVRHLTAGAYQLVAVSDGYRSPSKNGVQVNAGVTDVRLQVRKRAAAVGRVVGGDGNPIQEFKIDGTSYKSEDGSFRHPIDNTRRGQTELVLLFDAGETWAQTVRRVRPSETTDAQVGDVVLSRGTEVSGRVVDAVTGEAIAHALVDIGEALKSPDEDFHLDTDYGAVKTDVDGNFRLPSVEERPLWVFASHEQYLKKGEPLAVRSGVVLRLERGATISGRVLGLGGRGYLGSIMAVARPPVRGYHHARIEAGGAFKLLALRAGEYEVTVTPPSDLEASYEPRRVQVPAQGTVVLELSPRLGGAVLVVQAPPRTFALLVPGEVAPIKTFAALHALGDRGLRPQMGEELVQTFRGLSPGPYSLVVVLAEGEQLAVQTVPVVIREGNQKMTVAVDATAPRLSINEEAVAEETPP